MHPRESDAPWLFVWTGVALLLLGAAATLVAMVKFRRVVAALPHATPRRASH